MANLNVVESIFLFFSLTITIILTGLISSCAGIECHVCNSAFQDGCDLLANDNKKYLVTCSPSTAHSLSDNTFFNETAKFPDFDWDERIAEKMQYANFSFCRKQVINIPKQDNKNVSREGVTRVIRSCGYLDSNTTMTCINLNTPGIQNRQCQCNEDACNYAESQTKTTMTTVLVLSLMFIMSFILKHLE